MGFLRRHRRLLLVFLLLYAALVGLSHLKRSFDPPTGPLTRGQLTTELPAVDGTQRLDRTVTVAYEDFGSRAPDAPVVLLLHGSPVPGPTWEEMRPHFPEHWRIISPDLPGFGGSTREIPDYSARAHARYTLDLLDHLGITEVHAIAYSQGGAVALRMAQADPARLRSLVMLSSVGVQELELLGDYGLNHALHGAQLALLWALQELTPHFGLLDNFPLNTAYARNFYDTDLRPLRRILEEFQAPMRIVHGRDDALVPVAAAHEHHRIVPQSDLVLLDGGHLLLFFEPQRIAALCAEFITAVEVGTSPTRTEATPTRLAAAARPFDENGSSAAHGLTLVILIALLALSTLILEDLACIVAGFLVANGTLTFGWAVFACALGIFVGDIALYLLGRFVGKPLLRHRPFCWMLPPMAEERAERWFRQRGPAIILITRFLPGTRLGTYFAAGVLKQPFLKFLAYFGIAAAIWTPLLILLAREIGAGLIGFYSTYKVWALPIFAGAGLLIYAIIQIGLPAFTWRGRRHLLGRWKRLTRWEFWPIAVVNAPVFFYVNFLGWLVYRRPTLFTLANPGIPTGGFIGERKSQILAGLGEASPHVAPWRLIHASLPFEARFDALRDFMGERGLRFPIVLKPDEGQRALGVSICRDESAARAYLEHTRADTLAQVYVDGEEYGLFYTRLPGEETGRIFSITIKLPATVTGDGQASLDRLILAHSLTVALAKHYRKAHEQRLFTVPAKGEAVRLTELGTHARGAWFRDGRHLASEALLARLDEISAPFEGFFFGRFDVKVPSAEDLQAGRNLAVLELNGLTSEATHIYDPRYSLVDAWRTLFAQWRLAYRIGYANLQRGHRPTSKAAFLRNWWESFHRQHQLTHLFAKSPRLDSSGGTVLPKK